MCNAHVIFFAHVCVGMCAIHMHVIACMQRPAADKSCLKLYFATGSLVDLATEVANIYPGSLYIWSQHRLV